MSSIVNKIKDALHSDNHHQGAPEGTHGPHNSKLTNAADPRVDSDRDGSNNMGASRTAGRGEYGVGENYTSGETTAPRTGMNEGGFGNQRTTEGTGYGANTGTFGTERGVEGAGYGANTGTFGTERGAEGAGYGANTGAYGNERNVPQGTHGPHSNRAMNTMDPRVDSDRDGRAAAGYAPGPAPNTAGPHTNDVLNKVDPRIDSDLDGSKTLGGNKTYQSGNSSTMRDPTDASQVPPSVLRQHLGDPSLEHTDMHHGRERRNSIKTHQENFRGI